MKNIEKLVLSIIEILKKFGCIQNIFFTILKSQIHFFFRIVLSQI